MEKISKLSILLLLTIWLTGCSYSPGVAGLNTSSSRYTKPHVEGVDYKLIVINRDTIAKQKPFDYENFIRGKKKRHKTYNLLTLSDRNKQQVTKNRKKRLKYNTPPVKNKYNLINEFVRTSIRDSKKNYHYHIGKRDILSITVWDHPELTIPAGDAPATHVIGSDGKFYFPYAGKIQAAGRTVEEIRIDLEKKLKAFIAKPQVSVRVTNFRSQKAYISGAVLKPASIEIDDLPLTVRDAISKSGGVSPRKYTGYATLKKDGKEYSIDLNRMLKLNDNSQNFILRNGDRLHVVEIDEVAEFRKSLNQDIQREKEIALLRKELERELKSEQAKIFVMGEVGKPGSIQYQVEDGMTLAESINDAGSFREESVNPRGIFVVRQENKSDKIPTVYQLPVASVHSMLLAEQFDLRPRDIVYVTATPSIRWNRVLGLLLPSLTLLNTFNNLTN